MRPATAVIDLAAIRHNLARAKDLAGGARVVAVVKANAYGHGAARVLPALGGADMLGVACVEEALALREAGAAQPILLLEGVFAPEELADCARLGFEVVVHEPGQLAMLEGAGRRLDRPLTAWLKLDTGMRRLGFAPEAAPAAHARLAACPAVAAVRLMTHFANADAPGDPLTGEQVARFQHAAAALDRAPAGRGGAVERSLCNSAGLLAWPEARGEWVRPGIMLYGASPLAGRAGGDEGLRPAMSLRTRLIAVREVRAGERVGYGGAWAAPAGGTRVGIAAIGYGDGYPRHAPSGTPVLVNGAPAALAGRVSMDMLAIDLGGQPGARVGDPVLLWGEGLPVEQVAARAGTIAYELLCGITGRVHVESRDAMR